MSDVDLFGDDVEKRRAIGSHHPASSSSGKDEWLTPPEIVESLGPFDLDPCAPDDGRRPWDTALEHYAADQDGLRMPWRGRVWLNPPYSDADRWLAKLAEHGTGTALIFARTETRMWFDHVWPHAFALLFLRGRLHFHHVDGKRARMNSGAPSVLIAYGSVDAERLKDSELAGHFIDMRGEQ